jgi:hypothetical protein
VQDPTDRYVLANVAGCAASLVLHVAWVVGWLSGLGPLAVLVPATFLCFASTMATHPEARVSRAGPFVIGVWMSWSSIWRTVPRGSLAVTGCFLAYIAWFFVTHRPATHDASPIPFFATMSAVCAHLFWSGVGTRLGALRVLREQRQGTLHT